jgi:hypothetical protein
MQCFSALATSCLIGAIEETSAQDALAFFESQIEDVLSQGGTAAVAAINGWTLLAAHAPDDYVCENWHR